MRFYLGSHEAGWIGRFPVSFCIARHRALRYKRLPRALCPWILDSGGFQQLHKHGRYTWEEEQYAEEVSRFEDEAGQLAWAAPMDWMCEETALAQSGLSIEEHQHRTVENYLRLELLLPGRFIPVLQGWDLADYERCADLYEQAGVELTGRTVGFGSICRRNATASICRIIRAMAERGIDQGHAFGVKGAALRAICPLIESADSLAWSTRARNRPPLSGHSHKTCSNCPEWALLWREQLLTASIGQQRMEIPA